MAAILDFQSERFYIYCTKITQVFLGHVFFSVQVTPMLPSKFGLSVQEKKRKIDFQDGCHGGHLGFPIGMILAIFDLQVTPMLASLESIGLSVQEKQKIDFHHGGHGAILDFRSKRF